jgi:CTP synthase (UTP-ammonia lyase)
MRTPTRIGVIGDFNPTNPIHIATDDSIEHSSEILNTPFTVTWLATDQEHDFSSFRGLLCSSGSPYRSLDGALKGIRYAREKCVPFLGTCGGFQHLILEYARNVLGLQDADHAEISPDGRCLIVTPLACSLVGQTAEVSLEPGSGVAVAYGSLKAAENFLCSFGLNPEYRAALESAGLKVTGWDDKGDARIVELISHPYFVGTLFVPQARSLKGQPHPLLLEFCRNATKDHLVQKDR